MNTNIYTNIKLVLSAAAAGLLVLSSCSKWTEPEALDFAGMGDVAADSEEYLAALRAFKQTDHKVMILGMDATAEQPFSRFQHISAMPDSADYICVRNAVGGIYPVIAEEIAPVRQNKGTKVICDVDYMAISDAWDAIEDAKEDGEAPGTDDEFVAYVAENTAAALACCDKYGFDGIMVSYRGIRSGNGTIGQEAYMAEIAEWRASHPDDVMIFSGSTLNVIDKTFFSDCDYVVIPAGTDYSSGQFNSVLSRYCASLDDEVKQRIVLEVNVPSEDYPRQEGYDPQPVEAAAWVLEEDTRYGRAGLCVDNVQEDYLVTNTFSTVRKAIAIMNTAPSAGDEAAE